MMAAMVMVMIGHDFMIVGFTSTYGSSHGHDCMIVRFTSTYGTIGRSKSYYHSYDSRIYHKIMTIPMK